MRAGGTPVGYRPREADPSLRRTTVALAALSLLCGWLALRPEGSGAAVETAPRPVWTPERLPALLAEAQGTVDLERAVDQLLAESGARSCVAVYEGDRPVPLRRPDQALVPASTQKILVAAAALAVLGPDFRFETRVLADAPPRDGAVGRLWLVGSGDPALATPEYALWLKDRPRYQLRQVTPLASLATGLLAAGVRTVTGGIAGDDSHYDRTRVAPSWKATYVIDNEVGPLGALVVNGGFTVYEAPEQRAEDPAVHAAAELGRLAGALGITVAGPPAAGTPPRGPRPWPPFAPPPCPTSWAPCSGRATTPPPSSSSGKSVSPRPMTARRRPARRRWPPPSPRPGSPRTASTSATGPVSR